MMLYIQPSIEGAHIMAIANKNTYAKNEVTNWPVPNYWDFLALILVLALVIGVGMGAKAMLGRYHLGQTIPISLDVSHLPGYALRSVLRMLIALAFSFIFTFIFGTMAAKSKQAERIIIPLIDILQSVPVLGYLSITVVAFVVLFRGSLLGPECAVIFVIFTAQVWNMTLSFYQSLKTVPHDLQEAAAMFHLSSWQKFWKIEVPFAMPGLLWNAMMSMSGSWVFLAYSEAITVANQNITLPGIGSYIALAVSQANMQAVIAALVAMFVVIALYDQLLFRPLVAWVEKFKMGDVDSEVYPQSWLLDLLQRARATQYITEKIRQFANGIVNARIFSMPKKRQHLAVKSSYQKIIHLLWNIILFGLLVIALTVLWRFIFTTLSWQVGVHVLYLGAVTALRILVVIVISMIVWVPIGVWIGLSPRASQIVQPIAQFFAAFPVNLLFPLAALLILRYHLNVNIWCAPLMILGTQWYILFNVIAGTTALPNNLRQAVGTLNVTGWLWWKRLVLPAIFPYLITGAITAAGGAWNISIIAEVISWGQTHLVATGLGAYIAQVTTVGDFPRIALGIAVMSLFVVVFNYVVWRPLYNLAEKRFQIS